MLLLLAIALLSTISNADEFELADILEALLSVEDAVYCQKMTDKDTNDYTDLKGKCEHYKSTGGYFYTRCTATCDALLVDPYCQKMTDKDTNEYTDLKGKCEHYKSTGGYFYTRCTATCDALLPVTITPVIGGPAVPLAPGVLVPGGNIPLPNTITPVIGGPVVPLAPGILLPGGNIPLPGGIPLPALPLKDGDECYHNKGEKCGEGLECLVVKRMMGAAGTCVKVAPTHLKKGDECYLDNKSGKCGEGLKCVVLKRMMGAAGTCAVPLPVNPSKKKGGKRKRKPKRKRKRAEDELALYLLQEILGKY